MALRWSWLRFAFWVHRFHGLPRAERAFSGVAAPCILRRPLFGFRLAIDVSRTPTQRLLYLEGERFIGERFLLSRLVPKGGTVVDVGANVGYYLLLFEQLAGPDGSVLAIEPSAENLPELKRNVAENGFRNVELREVAVGASNGTVGFRSGINGGIAEASSAAYQVPLMPLDDVVGSRRVDFLKIDVEGGEGRVLAGGGNLLRRWRPVVFMEVHPHMLGTYGDTARGVVDRLRTEYETVELYENVEDEMSAGGKFAVRYLGRDPVRRIADAEAFLASMDAAPPVCTFWAVAKPGK